MRLKWRKPTGQYRGRLTFDGEHHLLADEGKWKGRPVAWDEPSRAFLFVQKGERSHNERYHHAFVVVAATTPNDPHHDRPIPDDPHFETTALERNTRLAFDPDPVAATITSHTEAWQTSE